MTSSIIDRCPDEVLQHIFECIVEGGSHLLRPILLVDARFHQLVVSSPRLWSKICLHFDECLDEENKLSPAFVKACVRNSRERPLDVYVGILSFSSRSVYFQRRVERHDSTSGFPRYDEKLEHLRELIRSITGSDGGLMVRWNTFRLLITCEHLHLYALILRLFCGELPNLQSLEVEHPAGDSKRSYLNGACRLFGQPLFTNMENARSISAPIDLEIGAFSLTPKKLERLQILYTGHRTLSEQICRLSLLSELHLSCDKDTEDGPHQLPAYNMTINLPSLRLLTLQWEVELVNHITFDVPNLRRWRFSSCRYDIQQYNQRGVIVSPSVEWDIEEKKWGEDDNKVGPCIRHFLGTIRSAETVKIFTGEDLDWTEVLSSIGEAWRAKEIAPSFQSMEIYAENGKWTWHPGMD